MARHSTPNRLDTERGVVLALCVHAVLLFLVLAQVVYLASRHRVRFDLTSDKLASTTESTKTVLSKLDKRLLIEAYFSPRDKLPVNIRETRIVLDNFLDELVQLGNGKVILQRFDPNADKAIADRCGRIGVQPLDLQSTSSTSLSVERHWQGLRFRYGGDKSKVMPQCKPPHPFLAEAELTPAIKEVTTEQKHKIGYMEWPAQAVGQQQPGGIGWNLLRTVDQIAKRFEFQNYKDEDGVLLPADLETLFLFRPKDLTDRHKYVLDQFLMRGGKLVVFADAAEYAIGPQRQFTRMPFVIDANGSQKKFTDQLLSHGIDWKQKLVADLGPQVQAPRDMRMPYEYYAVPRMNGFGGQTQVPVAYPYFFHPRATEWKNDADLFSKGADGKIDAAKSEYFQKQFVAGMPTDDFLFRAFKQLGRGPGFYWPTWVGLRQKPDGALDLPEGVTGNVLLWSSPGALAEDPPQVVDPLGRGDPQTQQSNMQKFLQKFAERYHSEPRQQAPLMVDVRGTFASFFAGAEKPKRPSEIKEEAARKAAADAKEKQKDGEPLQEPEAGPPKPEEAPAPAAPPEAEMLQKCEKPGRIVVIGDSDFLRDDLLRGDYRQLGGPNSVLGGAFFAYLLDWLAEDRDLLELQSRVPVDRTLKFIESDSVAEKDPRLAEQALRSKTTWLRAMNVLLPAGLLGVFGLFVSLVRRAQKRKFLSSLG